ncbi:MAG TPA: Hpt domain-containing protein [Caldilineaceae bacterium]|nr:Hpt domain-containing protein [Caldilineaceae bacterium]
MMEEQEMKQPERSQDDQPPAISAEEFMALADMVGADMPEVLVDLLDTYLEESAGLISALAAANTPATRDQMMRPAHSLKSSSASVGALRLSQLCADLESFLRGYGAPLDVDRQVRQIEAEFVRVREALEAEKAKLTAS